MKKEIYIKILKYVDDSPEGVTLNQLREKFDFSGKEAQIVWEQLTQGREGRAALLMHYSKQKDEHGNDYDLYTLSFEGVAFLLEYEELVGHRAVLTVSEHGSPRRACWGRSAYCECPVSNLLHPAVAHKYKK